MIARELLVKLGFDIDERKLQAFTQNVDNLKSKMSGVKAKMLDLRSKINQSIYAPVDAKTLVNYKDELKELSKTERSEIAKLNKQEQIANRNKLHSYRLQYKNLAEVNSKLNETRRNFEATARRARAVNTIFSRYFTRFAVAGVASSILGFRSTLKDAKDFQEHGAQKTNNVFSKEQLDRVERFNISLKQTRKALGEMRNQLVTNLLPVVSEYLDDFRAWLKLNKELINSKLRNFIGTLTQTFNSLASGARLIFNALNPLVQLVGSWGTVLAGFIGMGIISWLVRFGIFAKTAASSIIMLSSAMLANPLIRGAALLASAIALIADEIYVTIQGGDSLINRFKPLKVAFEVTKLIVLGLVEAIKELGQQITNISNSVASFHFGMFDRLGKDFKKLKDYFRKDNSVKFTPIMEGNKEDFKGLNVYYANRATKSFQNTPTIKSQAATKDVTINQKHTFNTNINVPKGTSTAQSQDIARQVEEQVQAQIRYENEKALNAIGAY